MKYLILGIIGMSLPAITDWLVDRQFSRPSYSHQQVTELHYLQDQMLYPRMVDVDAETYLFGEHRI